jgi:beta-N-acetylhexosaminidase
MPTAVLRRTIADLFMVPLSGPTLDRASRRLLEEHPPGGVVLFRRNIRSAGQLADLTAAIHALEPGRPPIVALDHEGGRVHRLPAPFTHFPPAATAASRGDARVIEAVGLAMGRELRSVGVDLDFAPVLDVRSNPRNRVIGDRAFDADPLRVARFGIALARGLLRAGVLPCGKHFPGHGASTGDSHFVLPRVRRSRRALAADLVPFARAIRAGIPALMTAHVVYPALDKRRPATLSPLICERLLRRRLGFRGVLFSDDLEMNAVAARSTPGAAAVQALAAGCDMLLVCQSLAAATAAMRGVEAAIADGRLAPERIASALSRIEHLRGLLAGARPAARPVRGGWPAHARLARRLAAA